jgi:Ribbon-helix-helix domain
MPEAVRWNIRVSKETDVALRTLFSSRGMKPGELSKFIEEAVRWRVFRRTIEDIKTHNEQMDSVELQEIIDSAVSEVRAEKRSRAKALRP